MASIVEKVLNDGSKAYLVRYRTPDGMQRSKQFKRKRDASAYVNVVEVDRMSGALVDPRLGRITVAEWWDQWWPTVTNLRPSTRARDAQYFRSHVLPTLGSTPLGKLDRTALRRWMVRLGAADGSRLAPATIHKVVQVLNKSVNAAVEDRIITHNPVARLPLPRIEHQEMRFLNSDELWTLADAIDRRYRAFVLLAGFGGLRLGELLGLRWARINAPARRINVAETLVDVEATHPLRTAEDEGGCAIGSRALVRHRRIGRVATYRRHSVGPGVLLTAEPADQACVVSSPVLGPGCPIAPTSRRCASTISGTPPCHCGSPKVQTHARSPRSPATHPYPWCSIATGTSTRPTTTR